MNMRTLIIGGTGTISAEVTKRCLQKGWDVTLLNRGRQNARLGEVSCGGASCACVQLDIHDEAAVAAWLKNQRFDVVANFVNFNVAEVERDLRLFAGKTQQYIFISSASAYQKPLSHYKITESTPLANPHWDYSRAKIVCEERLMAAYRENGFPVTIVRPSHTYDGRKIPLALHGEKGSWQTVKRILAGKPVLVPGDGNALWTLTHSQDLAKGFEGLMGNGRALGEAVHITSDESLSWNQIYQALGRALGVAPVLAHVATDFLVACDPHLEGPLLGDKSANLVFDNRKIKGLVPDFCARIPFDRGIRSSVAYFLAHPEMQVEDPDFDRFTEAVLAAQAQAVKVVQGI